MLENCAASTSTLPYVPSAAMPWNLRRVAHLHRRAGFGAPIQTLLADLDQAPVTVVDRLLAEARALPPDPEPDYAGNDKAAFGGALALLNSTLAKDGRGREWVLSLQDSGLRGRMDLFWHNHFVTKFDVYESAAYGYEYQNLIQRRGLGNFRDLVREMGLTRAMLVYLNGDQNIAASPNENYARELYELFTLGDANGYTQTDIVETARALTGYTNTVTEWGEIRFDPATHDGGAKTIFGRTGSWGYDDVIDILFAERGVQVSEFIAGKVYAHFVNPDPEPGVIASLAQTFRDADFEIAALMRAVFVGEHFYDEAHFATIIPGHIEQALILRNELAAPLNGLTVFAVYYGSAEQGQALFNPVDVAGWPGNRSWINTTSLRYRWEYAEETVGPLGLFNYNYLWDLARGLTDGTDDVEGICRDLVAHWIPKGLQFASDFEDALVSFKGNVPANYFTDGTWSIDYFSVPFQVADLLRFLVRHPEFQLR